MTTKPTTAPTSTPALQALQSGVLKLDQAISRDILEIVGEQADSWYERIDNLALEHGPWQIAAQLPREARYLAAASSIAWVRAAFSRCKPARHR